MACSIQGYDYIDILDVDSDAYEPIDVSGIVHENTAPIPPNNKIRFNSVEDLSIRITPAELLRGWSDAVCDTLSVSSLSIDPTFGMLVGNSDGSWSFIPTANFNGEVELSYAVTDGSLSTEATARLTIQPVNDAPVLSGTPVVLPNGTEDVAYILKASDLLKGYSDVDGDILSITSVTTASANGTITNNGDGTWTYIPTTSLNGKVSFSFVVSDGYGGSANGSNSMVLDPAPEASGDAPNLLKATLRGDEITLQFDNELSDTLPSSTRFTINHSARSYQVIDTKIKSSDGIVTLTAEKELDPTVALTLDYLDFAGDQTSGVIESPTGVDLGSFTGFALNNQGSQDNSLTIDDGEFEGNQITLFLSAPISDAIPSKRRFKIKSANKKQKLLDVSIEPEDGIIVLTTKKNLDLQESVTVSYRDLGGDQVTGVVEDLAGNDMVTIRDYEIISGGDDSIAPRFTLATLDESILSVEFDSVIRNAKISKNRFKVKVDGKRVKILSATVEQDDTYVELKLQPKKLRKIDINSTVTLSYSDPKGDQSGKVVEDIFGNDLESFGGYRVEIVKI